MTSSNNLYDLVIKAYNEGAVFVAFDLETTGLEPRMDQIVEIGAIKFDREGPIARFSTLINPGIPMPAEAGRVNNITDEMLKGKPFIDDVFPEYLLFIQGAILAAHNAPFDCGFINQKLKDCWEEGGSAFFTERTWTSPFPALPNPIADTLVFSREAFRGLPSYSLQNLAVKLGLPAIDAHRAEDDARLCMEIFIRIHGLTHIEP